MRISTDPTDPAYIDDRPRRVTVNDVEVTDWLIADEFRRSVVLKSGKVLNGCVGIERLADEGAAPVEAVVDTPIATGFSGMFVSVQDAPAAATPAPTAAPPKKHKKRR
jgi:hypothetical protein